MEGINSVFFVTKDRFTKEEADAWDVMWQVLFGAEVWSLAASSEQTSCNFEIRWQSQRTNAMTEKQQTHVKSFG